MERPWDPTSIGLDRHDFSPTRLYANPRRPSSHREVPASLSLHQRRSRTPGWNAASSATATSSTRAEVSILRNSRLMPGLRGSMKHRSRAAAETHSNGTRHVCAWPVQVMRLQDAAAFVPRAPPAVPRRRTDHRGSPHPPASRAPPRRRALRNRDRRCHVVLIDRQGQEK